MMNVSAGPDCYLRLCQHRKLNSSYHATLASKPSSIAPLCVSMQLSDASECCYLPQVAVILPVVSLHDHLINNVCAILTCLIKRDLC